MAESFPLLLKGEFFDAQPHGHLKRHEQLQMHAHVLAFIVQLKEKIRWLIVYKRESNRRPAALSRWISQPSIVCDTSR